MVSDNYHKAKSLCEKYNIDKKLTSKVTNIEDGDHFQRGKHIKLFSRLRIHIIHKIMIDY